jgi:hypothetical protein
VLDPERLHNWTESVSRAVTTIRPTMPRGRLLGQPGATVSPGVAPRAATDAGGLQEAFGMDWNDRACAASMEVAYWVVSMARVIIVPVSTETIPGPGVMRDVL